MRLRVREFFVVLGFVSSSNLKKKKKRDRKIYHDFDLRRTEFLFIIRFQLENLEPASPFQVRDLKQKQANI